MKRYLTPAIVLVALVAAGAVLAVTQDAPPAPPPWVGADGTVDISKAPDELEVSGPNGEVVVCANGRRLKVRKELLFGPPAKTPAQLRAQGPGAADEDLVWRCGKGRNPHLNPELVPRSQDPLANDAG
jgi:hypothetical protein